jgi:hypothetical protein
MLLLLLHNLTLYDLRECIAEYWLLTNEAVHSSAKQHNARRRNPQVNTNSQSYHDFITYIILK